MEPKKQISRQQIIKLLKFLFKSYRWKLLLLSLIAFVTGLLESLNLLVLYPLVNYGLNQKSEGLLIKFFDQFLVFSKTDSVFLFYCLCISDVLLVYFWCIADVMLLYFLCIAYIFLVYF